MKYVTADEWNYSSSQDSYGLFSDGLDFFIENAAHPWSLSQPAIDTLRFEVQASDIWRYDSSSKNRSEIADQTLIPDGTAAHVSYAFQLEPGPTNTAAWCAIGQFHQNDYPGEPANSPPFSIGLTGDRMQIAIEYTNALGTANYQYLYTDTTNLVRGQFYDMDIQVTFDPSGEGRLVVKRDGVTIVNYTGPLGVPGQTSVYWKEGIYRAASPETLAVDYKGLSVTTASPGATTVPPGNPTVTTPPNNPTTTPNPPGNSVTNPDGSKTIVTHPGTDTQTSVYSASGALVKVTVAHADGSTDITNYAITGQAYTTEHVTQNAAGKVIEDDRSDAVGTVLYKMVVAAGITTTDTFAATGKQLTDTVNNADGSREMTNDAVVGQSFATEHMTLSSLNAVVEDDRRNTAGVTIYKMVVGSGTTTTDTFDAAGKPLTELIVHSDGSRDILNYAVSGQTYTTEHTFVSATGKVTEDDRHAGSVLVYSMVVDPAGGTTIDRYDSLGQETSKSVDQTNGAHDEYSYVLGALSEHVSYMAGGRLAYTDAVQANGSHVLALQSQGVTVTSTAGARDLFTSDSADTFVFGPGFGADSISGFHAGAGAGHDVLQIDAPFTGLQSLISQNAAYMSGQNTVIALAPTESITLTHTALSSLTDANFRFV